MAKNKGKKKKQKQEIQETERMKDPRSERKANFNKLLEKKHKLKKELKAYHEELDK